MSGTIILDSLIQDIVFEKIPSEHYSWKELEFGRKVLTSIDWSDFIFKTNKKIETTNKSYPLTVIFQEDSIMHDEHSYFKGYSANVVCDNVIEYEYTIGLRLPTVCFGIKNFKDLDYNIVQKIKEISVHKRFGQNKS